MILLGSLIGVLVTVVVLGIVLFVCRKHRRSKRPIIEEPPIQNEGAQTDSPVHEANHLRTRNNEIVKNVMGIDPEEEKKLIWKEERRKEADGEESVDFGGYEVPCTSKWQLRKGNNNSTVLSIFKAETAEAQNNRLELMDRKMLNCEREQMV